MKSLDERQNEEKVSIVSKNVEVTAAMRNHILTKIKKVEEITPPVIEVHILLEIQKGFHRAEILYKFSHFRITVHAELNDLYQAFDRAYDKLMQKVRKWKGLIQSHHGKKPSEVEMAIHVLDHKQEALTEINDQIEEENLHKVEDSLKPPSVVRRKKRNIPLLTVEEASMRIDLSNDNFLVYKAEEDLKLKVLYVRRDKSLGVLEVE
ncbi:MAG: ribosome-associated translation inhibitor RaiA [Verrucomicrobia bacterium]|nr:ribosome-associated translation inhibitor RaiA [Verrucomicrobiota bacterium]